VTASTIVPGAYVRLKATPALSGVVQACEGIQGGIRRESVREKTPAPAPHPGTRGDMKRNGGAA
jgi:hypothetical protein